ncbi:hypothetical protein Zmor_011235 [Zophobas morio]|uniref:Mos1 transposase HTH domain-containing protein n=1 Tax=Zophobas morio TaxID=2755281 RepID=A0AA38IQM5_9CUCU|nr:hypothetical protein Zmor_011235 [Zophobas morio]
MTKIWGVILNMLWYEGSAKYSRPGIDPGSVGGQNLRNMSVQVSLGLKHTKMQLTPNSFLVTHICSSRCQKSRKLSIKLLTPGGISSQNIKDRLDEVYGQKSPTYSVMKEWSKRFRMGQKSLEDDLEHEASWKC